MLSEKIQLWHVSNSNRITALWSKSDWNQVSFCRAAGSNFTSARVSSSFQAWFFLHVNIYGLVSFYFVFIVTRKKKTFFYWLNRVFVGRFYFIFFFFMCDLINASLEGWRSSKLPAVSHSHWEICVFCSWAGSTAMFEHINTQKHIMDTKRAKHNLLLKRMWQMRLEQMKPLWHSGSSLWQS